MLLLDDIFDQPRALDVLRRAWLVDRLPHGLIFAGPKGVGKATAAAALATLFLCDRPDRDRPCGLCPGCRGMTSGNHPDYHVIEKEHIRFHDKTGKSKGVDLSINVVRPELIEPAGRKAVLGRGKVFIVEGADTMNGPAQNALLKTLEEPAGRTLIVLIADSIDPLLATIRSRCQMIAFAPLSEGRVRAELEKRRIDPATAAEAAIVADGSLGVALRLIEDQVIAAAKELTAQVEQLIAGRRPADLQEWFKKAADAYAAKQLERDPLSSKDAATRAGLSMYLKFAADRFRRHLGETDDAEELERTCAAIDAIARAETYLDGNVNVAVVFQQLSLALAGRFAGAGRP